MVNARHAESATDATNWWLLALSTVICVVTLYARQASVFHLPQFYAEEGRYFFADAHNVGWPSLFNTANGYFHLFPRLLANLTLTLGVPYAHIPAVFVFGCLPMYFLLWFLIFTRLALPQAAKVFIVLSTMLLPLGNEIFMNQTNIQWVMALIPVVLFCGAEARRPWGRVLDYVTLILCVFTGPYVLFLFPVFAVAALLDKRVKTNAVFLAICLVAMIICVWSLLGFGTVDRIRGTTRWTTYGYIQFVFRQYFFPWFSTWVDSVPEWAVIALTALLPALLVWIAIRVVRSGNRFAMISFAAGFTFFLATFISYGRHPGLLSPFANAIRNFYLPMVLLLWSIIAITPVDARRVSVWTLVFGWFAAQIPFIEEPRKMPDLRWEKYAERIGTSEADSMNIPITPAGWNMTLKKRD